MRETDTERERERERDGERRSTNKSTLLGSGVIDFVVKRKKRPKDFSSLYRHHKSLFSFVFSVDCN